MQIKRLRFKTIGSTNSFAKEQAETFAKDELTVITAEEQLEGRGRFTRRWLSPKGTGCLVTFAFFQKILPENLGNIPQVLALSALNVLQKQGVAISLKWPNDLVIQEKKLGGILAEVVEIRGGFFVILGIGININTTKEDLDKIDRPATSLFKETGIVFDKEKVEETLIETFSADLLLFLQDGFSRWLQEFRKALIHKKGDSLIINTFKTKIGGTFFGIDEEGALLLKTEEGTILKCSSGELV